VPEFELSAEHRDGTLVVKLVGDLDIVTSRQLDETLAESSRTIDHVVLDLAAVDFMDTSSLAVIVGHWKSLVAAGGSLALAGARFEYTRTLWITGLADRIPMYDSVDLAIAAQQTASDGAG
jgi:anti-sigma B factor antagonist